LAATCSDGFLLGLESLMLRGGQGHHLHRRWLGLGVANQAQQLLHAGAEQHVVNEAEQFVEAHHGKADGLTKYEGK
jgi:hypothetical protein